MSFKIRPLHERLFKSTSSTHLEKPSEEQTSDLVEDSVFVVDEDTGEIREEKQFVERSESSFAGTPAGNNTQPSSVPILPRKDSARVFGLSMKKNTKVSFM